ncbi:MAG: hypothetical protein KA746_13640 [Pyrinomonadaceae bacterium]|nr:hypothetical protein [Pyrinomonadaceae bacterium]MBP6214076.1 hypothetical protein [Pyrinomonadaceae bacterium]
MLGKNNFRKFITTVTVAAVWCVYSSVAFAVAKDMAGEITVTGQVTVNGQAAVSNSTVISGSTIVTGADSTAVVSLGKTGRIEVLANSSLTLSFSETSIIATLSEGKYRVSNAAGVVTTLASKNATIMADTAQANSFMVEVECSHTHVDTTTGAVTMREGSNDKQVAAGSSATAGNVEQTGCKPCLRPGSAPKVAIAGWPWLLLVAAGVAGAAVIFGTQKSDTTLGGGTIIVSPTR